MVRKREVVSVPGTTGVVFPRGGSFQFVSVENNAALAYVLNQSGKRFRGHQIRVLKHNTGQRFVITAVVRMEGHIGFLAPVLEPFDNEPITLEIEAPQPFSIPEPVLT